MFGKVKTELQIEHRRVGGGPGSYYEWRLPDPTRARIIKRLIDEGLDWDLAQSVIAESNGENPA